MKKRSIADARKDLPQLVRDAEAGEAVELTRRGERVAVILSADAYDRMVTSRLDFWEAYDEFRRRHDLKQLGIETDEFLAGVRDSDPGRDPRL